MRRYAGLSLMEVLLVLTISMGIIALGFRLYYGFKRDSDASQVEANANVIFQAMANYYHYQCDGVTKANQAINPGTLNPNNPSPPPANKGIDIQTELINPGFLTSAIVNTPIIKATGSSGFKGYIAQFNRTVINRQVCLASTGTGAFSPDSPNCTQKANVGQVISWQIQVAAELEDATTANEYLSILKGDCLSSSSGNIVTTCSAGSSGNFVVWTRTVSNATSSSGSTYWASTPTVTQFKQMYTTWPINNLTNGNLTSTQYYLCTN